MRTPSNTQYSERVIHGEIYKARPDVNSVCHHHSPDFMPLLATGADYVPVFHLGAVGGIQPPYWDQQDEFGDTNMLVIKPEEGASLARALGANWMVLMKRHGVTVAGTSVRDCVFRSVYSSRNAEYQVKAMTIGTNVASLSPGETKLCGSITSSTTGLTRAWEYWSMRVAKAGGAVAAAKTKASTKAEDKSQAGGKEIRSGRKAGGGEEENSRESASQRQDQAPLTAGRAG